MLCRVNCAGDFVLNILFGFFTAIAAIFLMIINAYILEVRHELLQKKIDQPPSYIECLINTPPTKVDEKKEAVLVIEDKKTELPVEMVTQERL